MSIYYYYDKEPEELCFTANTAGSTIQLNKIGNPTAVNLETSTDWVTWTDYTIWNTITLVNVWDKVYMRNKSGTDTGFSTSSSDYYQFSMTWSISASGDTTTLLNKNRTTTLSSYCYYSLFRWCTSLTIVPELSATTLAVHCYSNMFRWCTNLETLPNLPAIQMNDYCYQSMFHSCSKIKLSTTQTWEYQTAYRIPVTWTWTDANYAFSYMFYWTWWTYTSDPSINTTYYTSNAIV